MPHGLKPLTFLLVVFLVACAPILPSSQVNTQPVNTPQVIVKTVPRPVDGCGNLAEEYATFNQRSEDIRREQVKAIIKRLREYQDECDTLRLALFHSAPGKLRQTDATILDLLDQLDTHSERLGQNDQGLILLIKNELKHRAITNKKLQRSQLKLAAERKEKSQLFQRIAELELQLKGLKSLEENIAPE